MNEYDAYYRAFINYRKVTKEDRNCKLSRKALVNNLPEETTIEATKLRVVIEEDWVEEIEAKIVYLEKAVKEERQFIKTDGELIPIEKAKRVSRDSVVHLAKHSNLITKKPKGNDTLIPEKIYMVEKENDYTVYENRFLYYVLLFLKEFVGQRMEAINKALNTYKGNLLITKDLKHKTNEFKFKLELDEINYENPYYTLTDEEKDLIDRIDSIRFAIDMLLNTNLMHQVSKAPLIKLPIVKTNPIKMNNNFKKTLELFEFVNAYEKVGYELVEEKNTINPLPNDVADEYSDLIKLSSFLTYMYGTNIKETLIKEYELEEERIRQKEKDALAIQIKNLKHRIEEEKISPYEYMLLLEKRNRILENDCLQLASLKTQVIELKNEKVELEKEIKRLNIIINNKDKEIEALNLKYETDMALLKEKHRLEIESLTEEYETKLSNTVEAYEEKLSITVNECEDKINNIVYECDNEKQEYKEACEARVIQLIDEEREKIQDEFNQLNLTIDTLNDKIESLYQDIDTLNNEKEELTQQAIETSIENTNHVNELNNNYAILLAEKQEVDTLYLALRTRVNDGVDFNEFTEVEKFRELEKSKLALDKLFNEAWNVVKKDIRRKKLWDILKEARNSKKKK